MGRPIILRLVAPGLLGALLLLAPACGDDDAGSPTGAPKGDSPTPAATAAASPSAPPTATATTRAPTPADAALAAAAAKYNALIRPATEPCARDNPKEQPCAWLSSPAVAAERGAAAIGVGAASGNGGFVAIFGRDSAGAWDLWFPTQNQSYHVWNLPADMLVCADGDGLNARRAPGADAPIVTLLKDLTRVRAEEFVLAAPAAGAKPGTGWYRISSPVEGWAHSSFLSDAKLNDCALRDFQTKQ